MALEEVFNSALQEYVTATTSPESPLLTELRMATLSQGTAARMLSGPVVGQLLQLLIKLSKATHCLEVGTFTGYSALQMAEALPADGTLITCDNNPSHLAIAQHYFAKSPVGHKIIVKQGEALSLIDTFSQPFDFIFIDADKKNYPLYYSRLLPKLAVGGLLVVDNALWSGKVIEATDPQTAAINSLNQQARNDPRVTTLMLTVRDGILICYKNTP